MATFQSNVGNGYYLRAEVWERANSVNVGNNTTIVDWELWLHATNSYFSPLITLGNFHIAGNHVWGHNGNLSMPGFNSQILLNSGGLVVGHNSDGTQSVGFSGDFRSQAQTQSWHVPQLNLSGSIVMSRIPRGPRVKHGGQWRNTVAYVKHGGQWKTAIPHIKHGGQWKIGGG